MVSVDAIIKAVCLAVLFIFEIILFLIATGSVLPSIFMRVRCSVRTTRDRGMQKYVFPDGRAVAYEPEPATRKYIHRYVLYVSEGYKYLKCRVDEGVGYINYTVVMFNNRNRVVDVIDVKEKSLKNAETGAVRLHPDTSYIALIPNSINGVRIHRDKIMYRRVADVCVYGVLLSVISYIQMVVTWIAVLVAYRWLSGGVELNIALTYESLWLPALVIGGIAVVLVAINDRIKGLRWA
jgi:hypothetical protein